MLIEVEKLLYYQQVLYTAIFDFANKSISKGYL